MANADKYSLIRPMGREHVPIYPKGFIALRITQLVLSLITLGLCAFGAHLLPLTGAALMLFTSSATIITIIWLLIAHHNPQAYNYWAVLALDIFLTIFWLCSFALLASQAALVFGLMYYSYCTYYSCTTYDPTDVELAYGASLAAAAGIGGLLFLLFVTSLAIHGVALHRHRKAGLHCKPLSSGAGGNPVPAPMPVASGAFAYAPQNQNPEKYATQTQTTASPAGPYSPYQAPMHGAQPSPQPMYDPAQNRTSSPPVAQPVPGPNGYYQPQPYYPNQQHTPPPLMSQHTGGSYVQQQQQQQQHMPMPMPAPPVNTHEAPAQQIYQPHQ